MASLALAFDILARDKGASSTFKKVGDSAEKAGGQIEKTADRSKRAGALIAGGFGAMAAGAGAAVAGLGLAAVGLKKITDPAARAEQSIGGVESVFKGYAKEVIASAKAADRALGLSANTYRELATVIGSQLKNAGVSLEDVGDKTDDLITQGADLAAMFGGTTAEAVAALSSALKGEMDPIERYGISLNDAALKAEAMSLGLYDGKGALDANAKAMAVMSLVTKQGADSTGAFAREQDTAAGRAERAAAQWDNLKVAIGDQLLPVWSGLMDFVGTTALPKMEEFLGQMESGEGAGGKFRDGLEWVRGKAVELKDIFVNEVIPRLIEFRDFVRDEVVPRLQDFGGYIRDELGPRLSDLRTWFEDDLKPAMTRVRDFLRDEFQPSWEELVKVYKEDVKPSLDDLRAAFERNKPEIMEITRLVGLLIGGMLYMETKMRATILPVLIDLAGAFGGFLLTEIGKTLDKIGFVVDKTKEMKDAFKDFMEAVREFKLPGWITGVAGASAGVAAVIKGATVGILGAVGDGPGRNGGGNTLNRVKGILPAGAQITSTYRTPAQNRAVGGVTGSYHTDRGNPAVDIAGSRAAMDQVYARLASMGGWRELLYKTKGHWDHVHVAHEGGTVSANWPKMPGWGANERPVRAEVGETILPRGAGQVTKRYDITVNNHKGALTGTDLVMAQREAEILAGDW